MSSRGGQVTVCFLVGLVGAPAVAAVVLGGVDMLPAVKVSMEWAVIGVSLVGVALISVGVWPTAGRPQLRAGSIGAGLGLLLSLLAIFQWVWPARG